MNYIEGFTHYSYRPTNVFRLLNLPKCLEQSQDQVSSHVNNRMIDHIAIYYNNLLKIVVWHPLIMSGKRFFSLSICFICLLFAS